MTQRFISGFIILWLTFQISIPFFRAWDFSRGRYQYALFSWAMYSKPALIYEVSFFKTGPSGKIEAIENISNFFLGYRSPEFSRMTENYRSETEIKKRFADLIDFIAQKQPLPGYRYSVTIRWTRTLQPVPSVPWTYTVPGSLS